MKSMPLISFIVPCYNVESYINTCVDSIVNQNFLNIEVVLVDDGSSDNTGAICDEYAEKDNRIHVIHQDNLGVSQARNSGLEVAKGKWIWFADSDDYIKEDSLKILSDTKTINLPSDHERVANDIIFKKLIYI